MNLSDRIKELADRMGVTMYTISQETGISQSTLSRFVTGKGNISRRNLKILSDYFQVSLDWLTTGEGTPYLDSTKENDKGLRLKDIIDRLGLTQSEFAEKAGIHQSNLSEMISGKRSIGENIANKLYLSFGINKNWLLNGEIGDSTIDVSFLDKLMSKQQSKTSSRYPAKPFIDSAYAACGVPSGFSMAIKEAECEKISIPFTKDYDFSIKAKGDSMINRANPLRSIRDGDLVVCRLWKSRSYLRWGEVYALATTEGVVIKKIQKSEKEGYIKCISFNEEDGFEPYELPIEEIYDWAIVLGAVSVKMWSY